MNSEFVRYSCQIALPGFREEAQIKLQNAKVLVVGAGGLGCPAAQYLAAAGVGTLGIADFDIVSDTNLHRQVLYGPVDFGKKKVTVACDRLQLQNPGIKLIPHDLKVTSKNVLELFKNYDIIVDGTDNFETRYLVNDSAVLTGIPVVYGAIYQFEGQVSLWNLKKDNGDLSPNYRDVFPRVNASQIPNCSEGGVIPTIAGVIGSLQANEVIKYITGIGELLAGKILVFDAQSLQSRIIKIGDTTKTYIHTLQESIEVKTITIEELQNEKNIQLIDVRTAEERHQFDIGGELIPLAELDEYIDSLNSQIKTVFYCATGKRSADAVKMMKKKYPNADVYSLEGGINSINK